MKIYIASRFRNGEVAREIARNLRSSGYEVTSTWHDMEATTQPLPSPNDSGHATRAALRDISEIDQSDAVLLLTEGCEAVPGGMWFEAGYAYAKGKGVFISGPRINVFCHLLAEWGA